VNDRRDDRDWSRTPAALFACAVLGILSLTGLGWSISRSLRQPPQAVQPTPLAASDVPATRMIAPPTRTTRPDAIKRVDVNTADLAELDLLPGIGPALRQRIIDSRTADGPFESIDDLQRVSGIGPRTVEKLRPLTIVSQPDPDPEQAGPDG